jgi:large subunit ribosomal protein L24
MQKKLHVKKGDDVVVITGSDRGKKGKVLKVIPDKEKIIVENVNFIKKHTRPNQRNKQGGIIEKEAPIHASNVMLFSEKLNAVTKAVIKDVGGSRVRVCKKTGDDLK